MSASWSWASLAAPRKESPEPGISKVTPDLSTCPKMQDNGQVDSLPQPLEDTAPDWQAYFDERAGVAEHDGGISREKAEVQAYEACISHWLNTNPPQDSNPHTCPQCSQSLGNNPIALLTGNGGHIWLHDRCHVLWLIWRRKMATFALAGIMKSVIN